LFDGWQHHLLPTVFLYTVAAPAAGGGESKKTPPVNHEALGFRFTGGGLCHARRVLFLVHFLCFCGAFCTFAVLRVALAGSASAVFTCRALCIAGLTCCACVVAGGVSLASIRCRLIGAIRRLAVVTVALFVAIAVLALLINTCFMTFLVVFHVLCESLRAASYGSQHDETHDNLLHLLSFLFYFGVSLSFAKIMPMSAMKTCFQIAECSLSYAKIMPTSAMKTCFQIAECSLSYAKIDNRVLRNIIFLVIKA